MEGRAQASAIFLLLATLLASTGCPRPLSLRPIEISDTPPPLSADEGIAVLHVVTDLPFDSLGISGIVAARDLPKGDHLLLFAATPGSYRLNYITRTVKGRDYQFYISKRYEELRFTVEPGTINYPGKLIFKAAEAVYSGGGTYRDDTRFGFRTINRSAAMLRELTERHPSLLARYGMRYAGAGRDEFLDHYFEAQGSLPRRGPQEISTR